MGSLFCLFVNLYVWSRLSSGQFSSVNSSGVFVHLRLMLLRSFHAKPCKFRLTRKTHRKPTLPSSRNFTFQIPRLSFLISHLGSGRVQMPRFCCITIISQATPFAGPRPLFFLYHSQRACYNVHVHTPALKTGGIAIFTVFTVCFFV